MKDAKRIKKLSPEVISFLKKSEIAIIYLFGSHREGTETEKSDFDLAIVFQKEKSAEEIIELHHQLYNLFTTEFSATFQNEVDIVYLQNCSSSFQYYVVRNGLVIYEVSSFFRVNYEECVLKEYLDFKPIAEIFSRALLERG